MSSSHREDKASASWICQESPLPGQTEMTRIRPGREYVTVSLKYAHVANLRKGLRRFYGVVHSQVHVPGTGNPPNLEFGQLFAPPGLRGQNAKGFANLISLDRRLLGPVPYRGGALDVDLGLYSVEAENLLEPYLGVLESLSVVASGCFAGPAAVIAEPLRKGFLGLVSGRRADLLEAGLQKSWSTPRQSLMLVMPPRPSNQDRYTVRHDGHVMDENDNLVLDRSYLVLELRATSIREDWFDIPELVRLNERIKDYFVERDPDGVKAAIERFQVAAIASDDLFAHDAAKICEEVAARWAEVRLPTRNVRGAAGDPVQLPNLNEMNPFGLSVR